MAPRWARSPRGCCRRGGRATGCARWCSAGPGFGFIGNILPAGLNAVTAGIGWFAVNSISGALALHALTHMPKELSLIVVVAAQLIVAFFGHNLVHAFERYAFPVLAIIFVIAGIIVLTKAHPGMAAFKGEPPTIGGFLITVSACFGYAAGWNPVCVRLHPLPADETPSLLRWRYGPGSACSSPVASSRSPERPS